MTYTKEQIYNLTLSFLLLAKEVTEITTDTSNEVRVLNIFYNVALESTLKDLDLDSLSTPVTLELIEELDDGGPWRYAYKYPNTCAFFRRIQSCVVTDTERTAIPRRVGVHTGLKAIFTNEAEAIAEIIPNNVSLAMLSVQAGVALSLNLAILAAPLITGKGAKILVKDLRDSYTVAKYEAQEDDASENHNFETDDVRSSWVAERLS